MKFLLIICFYVFSQVILGQTWDEWETYKKIYKKNYLDQQEEHKRRIIFYENLQFIEKHNKKFIQNLTSYTVGINKFTDYLLEELVKASSPTIINTKKIKKLKVRKTQIPDSIDWRDYGVITPIRDQKYCMSCWAFAITATVEAHVGIHLNHKNETLSPEHLTDCVYSDFDCQQEMRPTVLEDSYKYLIDNNGLATEISYPYDQQVQQCRFKSNEMIIGAKIHDYVMIPDGDEEELKAVVGTLGPVTVRITTDSGFMYYRQGVYFSENCNDVEEPYNHAVTVVGYGEENGLEFWLVKNEWGTFFGDQGYVKLARNKNMCGIASFAIYPII